MIKEIGKLKADKKGVDAILVDLRSNGGGSLDESIKIAGLFVEKGPIVQTKGINNTPNIQNDDDPKSHYSGPLVVLIDRQSASASEIFAGAIQDYQRGLIVGDHHTFGKGTVQNLTDLSPRLGAIKVTISKFYRPSGNSTQSRGVESDIVFPSMADALEIGEKHYDYALEWEKIKGVKFKNYNAVKPYLPKLKEANEKRLASNKEFKEIFDALEEFEEKKEERKRISLRQKSKEELAKLEKEKADEEKKIKKDEYGNIIPDYEDDVYLKEAVQIAVDYARLQAGQNIVELATPRLEGQEAVIVSDRAKSKDAKVVTEKAPDQK
jgi:carboxyl-terminal processing protease